MNIAKKWLEGKYFWGLRVEIGAVDAFVMEI